MISAHLTPAELKLVRLAVLLGAETVGGPLSDAEMEVVAESFLANPISTATVERTRRAILVGDDPLGETLCALRPSAKRREAGAFYTPAALLTRMLAWAMAQDIGRLVDPGCGSGRFAISAVRCRLSMEAVAIDIDPVATLLTRAALAVVGARSARVIQGNYLTAHLPPFNGRTAFVGNPPYVRHHGLTSEMKSWATGVARQLGHQISLLAGLHAYFFIATALHARPGDVGCFVTSAEWLDVKYGSVIRELLLGQLGGHSIQVIDPRTVPFEDAMTTAAITSFLVGEKSDGIKFHSVTTPDDLGDMRQGLQISRARLAASDRWSPFARSHTRSKNGGKAVRLGVVARVHRGVATGANEFFTLTRERARGLGLEKWCRPAITSAEEVQRSGGIIRDGPERKLLLCVPADVDRAAHPELDVYLRLGERAMEGKPAVRDRYLPSHRRPWWYLGRADPAPIVATYMARQAPMFALNPDKLLMVNIAHGIYPRHKLSDDQLEKIVDALNQARTSFQGNGRTYHGGLEKFEPREMENLMIPAEVAEIHDSSPLHAAAGLE